MYGGIAPSDKSGCCNTGNPRIECRNGVAWDSREINCWSDLGVRDDPNLEAAPIFNELPAYVWQRGGETGTPDTKSVCAPIAMAGLPLHSGS
jgi:hypothetical protein